MQKGIKKGQHFFLIPFPDEMQKLVFLTDRYSNGLRTIIKSSTKPNSYKARWYRRNGAKEDPWISLNDHAPAIGQGNILYGENRYAGGHAGNVLPNHNGANVYIRNKGKARSFFAAIPNWRSSSNPIFFSD